MSNVFEMKGSHTKVPELAAINQTNKKFTTLLMATSGEWMFTYVAIRFLFTAV